MIYLGLGALALVLLALVVGGGDAGGDGSAVDAGLGGAIGPDQLASLAWTAGILALVVAGSWRRLRAAPGESLRNLAAWAMIGLALVVGYGARDRLRGVSAQVLGDLRPGLAVPGADGAVTVTRRADGAFRVDAVVNGRAQSFTFDTGADSVVLTAANAAALGLAPGPGDYTARVSTANGLATAAPVQLDSLSVGTITERRVAAMVARPGALAGNLLGQSFLGRLSGYEVRGDRLILKPP